MDRPLYGAAYYLEYLPYGRLEQDVAMMKAAGHRGSAHRGARLGHL